MIEEKLSWMLQEVGLLHWVQIQVHDFQDSSGSQILGTFPLN